MAMILTVKPDTKQAKRIKSLMDYTGEATATKAILFAAINYESKLMENEGLKEKLNYESMALEDLRERVRSLFRIKESAAQDIQAAEGSLVRWAKGEEK